MDGVFLVVLAVFFRVVAGGIGIAEKLWAGEFMT